MMLPYRSDSIWEILPVTGQESVGERGRGKKNENERGDGEGDGERLTFSLPSNLSPQPALG